MRDERTAAFGVGPADDDKFLPVEASNLEPETAVAWGCTGVQSLRDDAFQPKRAGMPVKRRTLADLVVAIVDRLSLRSRRVARRALRSAKGRGIRLRPSRCWRSKTK